MSDIVEKLIHPNCGPDALRRAVEILNREKGELRAEIERLHSCPIIGCQSRAGGEMSKEQYVPVHWYEHVLQMLKEKDAEIERLRGVIWRNCDPMAMTVEDAAIVEEISRLKALEGK